MNLNTDFCPYCGAKVIFVDSKMVYGKSYGMIYICSKYPKCDSYVGVHKNTCVPLGTLANKELRKYRGIAHLYFDTLWKNKKSGTRIKAYKWLSEKMNISVPDTHIGYFNIDQCKTVIKICKPYAENILNKSKNDLTLD